MAATSSAPGISTNNHMGGSMDRPRIVAIILPEIAGEDVWLNINHPQAIQYSDRRLLIEQR